MTSRYDGSAVGGEGDGSNSTRMPPECSALLRTGLGDEAQHQYSSEAREQSAHGGSLSGDARESKTRGEYRLVQRSQDLLWVALNGGFRIFG